MSGCSPSSLSSLSPSLSLWLICMNTPGKRAGQSLSSCWRWCFDKGDQGGIRDKAEAEAEAEATPGKQVLFGCVLLAWVTLGRWNRRHKPTKAAAETIRNCRERPSSEIPDINCPKKERGKANANKRIHAQSQQHETP